MRIFAVARKDTLVRTQHHITDIRPRVLAFSVLIGIVVVTGCAGGSQNSSSSAVIPVTPVTYTIGGTISGLSGTGLLLQDNGGNNLPVSGNGSFTLTAGIASGGAFNITVLTQPSSPAQTCVVTNSGGTVTSTNVTSVMITCIASDSFALTGGMTTARQEQIATLLNNGMVLVAGGFDFVSASNVSSWASAELYNPATGTFTPTGGMTTERVGQTATLLNNGQVLIAGGGHPSAELYNPATGTFTSTGTMITASAQQTSTLLNNGQVLIAGGFNGSASLAGAELYDPPTGTFTPTGNMTTERASATATLLNNGDVLIAGGFNGSPALASAELYDPERGTFTSAGNMTTERGLTTATLLNNGQVLIAGGENSNSGIVVASAELYDPATGAFTATGGMTSAREEHTATLLNNGQVLIAGGDNGIGFLSSAELYDPATGTFTATPSMMTDSREQQTATLLISGQVLIAGGDHSTSLASAELYLPATLTPTGIVSITVTPATPTLSVGSTQQFVATGTFSNGSMQNLQSVTWSSSNQAAGTITNDASDHGVALALAAGKSTITASAGSISGSIVLTVQ